MCKNTTNIKVIIKKVIIAKIIFFLKLKLNFKHQ